MLKTCDTLGTPVERTVQKGALPFPPPQPPVECKRLYLKLQLQLVKHWFETYCFCVYGVYGKEQSS